MSRRLEPWTEASIRAALEQFLVCWEVWPTYADFVRGGVRDLRDAITELRGPGWWAREMGLPGGERRPGGVRRWTDAMIRETLVSFLNGRTTWPTTREFDDAGLHAFREALRDYGDARRWAAEMGVEWTPTSRSPTGPRPKRDFRKPPGSHRERRYWTEERIAKELRRFLGHRSVWPRYAEFADAGHAGLYHAINRYGGTRVWAQRMGVRWPGRHGRSEERWTDARIRDALSTLLAGRRTRWPTRTEFEDAGALQLWRAVRRVGGERYWAAEFGLRLQERAASVRAPDAGR